MAGTGIDTSILHKGAHSASYFDLARSAGDRVDVEGGLHELTGRVELRQDRQHHQEAAETGQHHSQLPHLLPPSNASKTPEQ